MCRSKGKVWLRSITVILARTLYAYSIKFGFMRDLECPKCMPEARRADKESCEGAGGWWSLWCGWKVFSLFVLMRASGDGVSVKSSKLVSVTGGRWELSFPWRTNAVTDVRTPPHRLLTWHGSRLKGTKGLLKGSGVRVRV